jgi:uncharacterized protein YlxP (DUF503 family)
VSRGGFVAVLVVDLHFASSGSLKGKRKDLSQVKAGLQNRLGAAVAETGYQDLWQRSELTVAVTAGTQHGAQAAADGVQRWLETRWPDGVSVERTVVSVEDLR